MQNSHRRHESDVAHISAPSGELRGTLQVTEHTTSSRWPAALGDRSVRLLRILFLAALVAALAYFVVFSWRWPILRDTSIMHYVNFLMQHGMQPYAEITDNNLPGAYLAEHLGMGIFGTSDLAWRLCDFSVLLAITLAMVVIAKPYDWTAGLFGGGMFALLHGSEGPDFPMEREEVVTALLVIGFALLFTAVRRQRPWIMLLFGLSTGMAAAIKPTTAPFGVLVLLLAMFLFRRQVVRVTPFILWGFAGMAIAGLIVAAFLLEHHAFGPLLYIMRTVMPSYVSMASRSLPELLRMMMPRNLLLPTALGIALACSRRHWNAEWGLLLLAVLFGVASFVAQRKGSIYHRYPFVAFLLLLLGMEFMTALRQRGWPRVLGAAGLFATLLLSIPHYLVQLRASPAISTMPFATALTADLRSLNANNALNHQVECLDLTYGCFSALYHLDLVENNGFTGDLLLFSDRPSPAVDYYRSWFWRVTMANPPTVFVLSNEWFPHEVNFDKIATWPRFAEYLSQNYDEVLARSFPAGVLSPGSANTADPAPAYRLYIRKGSPLLANLSGSGRQLP